MPIRPRKHKLLRLWGALLALSVANVALATPDTKAQGEIEYLLSFVQQSSCEFIRNGASYDASAARDHLAHKLGNIRQRIRTAEDFIRYAASKSSLTGRPYQVNCHGQEQLASLWLTDALARRRMAKN